MEQSQHERFIAKLLRRTKASTSFGYGLSTASPYVKSVVDALGPTLCAEQFKLTDTDSAIAEARNRATYANDDLVFEEKATSSSRFKDLLPDGVEVPKHTAMVFRHVLTSTKEDRDNDILETKGAVLDPKAPLLWQHIPHFPIGKVLATIEHTDELLKVSSALLDMNDMTADTLKLIEAEVLRISHGFRALEFEERKDNKNMGPPGFRITKMEIMEASVVSVPSNTDATIEVFSSAKFASPVFKAYQQKLHDTRPVQVPVPNTQLTLKLGTDQFNVQVLDERRQSPVKHSTIERVKQFDPTMEHIEAATLEYDWSAKFIGCEIKDLVVVSTMVPSVRKGTYFFGEKEIQKAMGYDMADHRRITYQGKEMPPLHESVQCNREMSVTYMSDGMEFWRSHEDRIVVKHEKYGGAIYVTTYAKNAKGQSFINKCWDWALQNNFLKGEAFSLSGDFLERTGTRQSDIFLTPDNAKRLARTIELLNTNAAGMASRGVIMCGPPGTGKTLSCRAIKNETDVSYIWVTARDFWNFGAVDGICAAFDLAKEIAPSVICFEDVDNWIGKHSMDLLKTEMDGVSESRGVVTILTTNYPEKLPSEIIDRPGRFHEINKYDLPDNATRGRMLRAWTEDMKETDISAVVTKTEGYSGAHMYELVNFAGVLKDEDDSLDMKTALLGAVDKIDSQRSLIDANQLAGSHYRPMRSVSKLAMSDFMRQPHGIKAGRALSASNRKMLEQVRDDVKEIQNMDGVPRAANALCERCVDKLDKMIESGMPEEKPDKPDEDGKETQSEQAFDPAWINKEPLDWYKAAAFILQYGTPAQHAHLKDTLEAFAKIEEQDVKVEQFRLFTG